MERVAKKSALRKQKIGPLDIGAVRRYSAGLEALAREVSSTSHPLVLRDGLAVLAMQRETVQALLRGDRA